MFFRSQKLHWTLVEEKHVKLYFKTSGFLDQGDPGATTSGAIDLLAQKSFIYQ